MPQHEDTLLEQIEALYRARFADFVGVAAAIVGDRETAREAVQDAFASVVRNRAGYRRAGTLEAWVWRVVVNAARKARRARREPPVLFSSNGTAPPAEPSSEVAALVATLPERQRAILFLRYYADLDYREIGRILGVETGTVSAALHAAHRTLRKTLTEPT